MVENFLLGDVFWKKAGWLFNTQFYKRFINNNCRKPVWLWLLFTDFYHWLLSMLYLIRFILMHSLKNSNSKGNRTFTISMASSMDCILNMIMQQEIEMKFSLVGEVFPISLGRIYWQEYPFVYHRVIMICKALHHHHHKLYVAATTCFQSIQA